MMASHSACRDSRLRQPLTTLLGRWTLLLLAIACLAGAASASAMEVDEEVVQRVATEAAEPLATLVLDSRVPYHEDGQWTMLSQEEHELKKRALMVVARATNATNSTVGSNGSGSATTTISIPVATTTETTKPLPVPFDGGLAANFTENNGACPSFINGFLTDPNFITCYPVSMLLQSSKGFFEAMKSHFETTRVLDHSCAANVTFCASYLRRLARNLTTDANCGPDYQIGNQVVVQAYVGMIAYQTEYRAACLTDADTGSYCFANAVDSGSYNTYPYYLPLNLSLPGSSVPTCSSCLKQTMGIYQSASASRDQPIANTYVSAAQQINTICGPEFVNDSLPAAQVDPLSSGAARTIGALGGPSASLLAAVVTLATMTSLLL